MQLLFACPRTSSGSSASGFTFNFCRGLINFLTSLSWWMRVVSQWAPSRFFFSVAVPLPCDGVCMCSYLLTRGCLLGVQPSPHVGLTSGLEPDLQDGDSVAFFNFRGDRALELTKAAEGGPRGAG